jgi:hypothetical protein
MARRSEVLPGPTFEGAVLVDVGPGFGALVVHTPAALAATEIEIRRCGRPWDGAHTAVRARPGERWAAVFGSLAAGPYELRRRPPGPEGPHGELTVEVTEATVTEVAWPEAAGATDTTDQNATKLGLF